MIKVIAISDLHGHLPKIKEDFDLLLIGGDICPAWDHFYDYQHQWMMDKFLPWVMQLPFRDAASKVVFIGGNHDVYLDHEPKPDGENYSNIYTDLIKPSGGRLVYLEDDEFIYESLDGETIKIYGTPWCKVFGHWWFMLKDSKLKLAYDLIPEDVDILLTHDQPAIPPCGFITEGAWAGTDAGNKVLAEAVKEKKPKWVLSGHIHSSPHAVTDFEGIKLTCVSIMNEAYDPVYPPFVFEIEGKSAKDGEE